VRTATTAAAALLLVVVFALLVVRGRHPGSERDVVGALGPPAQPLARDRGQQVCRRRLAVAARDGEAAVRADVDGGVDPGPGHHRPPVQLAVDLNRRAGPQPCRLLAVLQPAPASCPVEVMLDKQ